MAVYAFQPEVVVIDVADVVLLLDVDVEVELGVDITVVVVEVPEQFL